MYSRQNEVWPAYQEKLRILGVVRKVSSPCGLEIILYIWIVHCWIYGRFN